MKVSNEIVERLIGMAIAKHGQAVSPTRYNTFQKAITVVGDIIMLWYDVPLKGGYTSGVVTIKKEEVNEIFRS